MQIVKLSGFSKVLLGQVEHCHVVVLKNGWVWLQLKHFVISFLLIYIFFGHYVHLRVVLLYIGVSVGHFTQTVKLLTSKTVPSGHFSQF